LFQRNVATNRATVPVQGYIADPGYTQVRLELRNEQGLVDQIVRNISYSGGRANFQFTTNITAARNNHEISISALRNGTWILVREIPRLLAGDIYIINGQSNAQALAAPHENDVDEYTRSWFPQFGWGTLNLSFPGLWGARLAKQISDSQNLPIGIFNQAVGAEPINSYLPTVNGGNYASLQQRFANANMANSKIRAAFWFHGEANSWGTPTEEYVEDFRAIKEAWERDYNIDYTFVYQMRYQSCTSEQPDILEAHRVIGQTFSNTDAISTTNANHDGCHFYYEEGYRELGDRMSELVKNRLYGSNNNLAYSPNITAINISNTNNRRLILEFDRNLPLKTIGGFPHQDFELEFSNASIIGGRVSGSRVELNLDQPIEFASGVSYLSHIGFAPGWITNQADVGIFTFHDFPIANGPVNSNTCNATYTTNGQQLSIERIAAPVMVLKVLRNDYSVVYACDPWSSPCSFTENINLAPGNYFLQIKTYTDDGVTTICDIFEEITIGNSTPTTDCPNLGANIGDSCNDGNPNTTNDVVQANCNCAGTVPPPTFDCPALSANIGDACNDGNSNTTNDVVQANCNCAGTVPAPTFDCPNLNANIGDSCNDGNSITTNDVVIANCICVGTVPPPTFDCPALGANIGDACNDGNSNTTNDVVQANCNCAGTVPPPTFDCPTLGANIGDSCNDGNSITTNDVVIANCICAGTVPPPTFDCPALGANIGDSCNDGNSNTNNDVVQSNCNCAGTPTQSNGCDVTYNLNGNRITFQNVDAPISFVKIMNLNFLPIFECNSWSNACTSTFNYDFAQTGEYYIQVQTQNSWTSPIICNIFEEITVSDAGGNNTCDNIINGGIVSGNEVLCPGENTSAFINSTLPSGGSGTVEYRWLSSTGGCPTQSAQVVQGANQSTYTPGQVLETTYFRRQARRAGCTEWTGGESNCVVKFIATDCIPESDPCDVTYQINNNGITIQNLDFPINSVKINDEATFAEVFSCDNWSSVCNPTRTSINLQPGTYFLNIQTYQDWNNQVCTISEMITIGNSRQGNGNNSPNLNDLEVENSISNIQKEVTVFPNPAQNEINVSLENYLDKDIQILMMDQMGKQQQEISIQNNQDNVIKIPIENVRNGIYLLWIHPEGTKPISKKVLVRKDY